MDDRIAHRVHDQEPTDPINPKLRGLVGPQRVNWRLLCVGSMVWAPTGRGWTPATVERLGKSRDDRTVVWLVLHGHSRRGREKNRKGYRYAGQLYWRKGKEKPHDEG